MYKFRIVKSVLEMTALRAEWNELWAQAHFRTPYQSFEWNYHWVRANRQDDSLHIVLVADDAGKLVGIAPLRRSFDYCSVAVLSFIGQEASVYPDFLLSRGDSAGILLCIMRHLKESDDCSALELKLTEPSLSIALLRDALASTGWVHVSKDGYTKRLRTAVGTDYDSYLQSLSQRMRQSISHDTRKLAKHFEVSFRTAEDGDFEASMMDVCRLNTLKWGGDPATAYSAYLSYYRSVRSRGGSIVFTLSCDGKIVGGVTASALDDTIYMEIAGFDFSVLKIGIGKVLDSMIMKWAIDNGIPYVDWMTGDHEYKYRYNPEELVKWKISAFKSAGARLFVRHATGLQESAANLKRALATSPLNRNGQLQSLVSRFRRQGG